MNKITAQYDKTKYWSVKHPCVFIDDERLDIVIDRIKPENNYRDLIPTLLSDLEDEKESELVWSRILPENGNSLLPILMCPDDVDLACTLIITEVSITQDSVIWKNFGLDMSYDEEDKYPGYIGNEVEWFTQNLRLEFPKEQYIEMIRLFQNEIDGNENE